jgi:hypothetical protein
MLTTSEPAEITFQQRIRRNLKFELELDNSNGSEMVLTVGFTHRQCPDVLPTNQLQKEGKNS